MGFDMGAQQVGQGKDVIVQEQYDVTTRSGETKIACPSGTGIRLPQALQAEGWRGLETPQPLFRRNDRPVVDDEHVDMLKFPDLATKHSRNGVANMGPAIVGWNHHRDRAHD